MSFRSFERKEIVAPHDMNSTAKCCLKHWLAVLAYLETLHSVCIERNIMDLRSFTGFWFCRCTRKASFSGASHVTLAKIEREVPWEIPRHPNSWWKQIWQKEWANGFWSGINLCFPSPSRLYKLTSRLWHNFAMLLHLWLIGGAGWRSFKVHDAGVIFTNEWCKLAWFLWKSSSKRVARFSWAILVWVHIKDIKLSVHLPLGVNQFEPSRCADPNGFPNKRLHFTAKHSWMFDSLSPSSSSKKQKKHPKPPKSQQKNQQTTTL